MLSRRCYADLGNLRAVVGEIDNDNAIVSLRFVFKGKQRSWVVRREDFTPWGSYIKTFQENTKLAHVFHGLWLDPADLLSIEWLTDDRLLRFEFTSTGNPDSDVIDVPYTGTNLGDLIKRL